MNDCCNCLKDLGDAIVLFYVVLPLAWIVIVAVGSTIANEWRVFKADMRAFVAWARKLFRLAP